MAHVKLFFCRMFIQKIGLKIEEISKWIRTQPEHILWAPCSCSLNCQFYQICSENFWFVKYEPEKIWKKSSHQIGIVWPLPLVFHFSIFPFDVCVLCMCCEEEESIPHQLHERMMSRKKKRIRSHRCKCRVSSWNWKMNEINSKIRQRVYGKSGYCKTGCMWSMCTKTAVPTRLCCRANVGDGPEKNGWSNKKKDKNSKSVIKRHVSQPAAQ